MNDRPVRARYQTGLPDGNCRCELCPRHCTIAPGKHGFCRHRANTEGVLYAVEYGQVASLAVDPIEKKPLYHFHPGGVIVSVGANGCNLACRFCQNWQLSEGLASSEYLAPEELAARGKARGSLGIAFTYNEPTIWFEYILDVAGPLREAGGKLVLVTNGYLEPEPWDELCRVTDAVNIDVKGDDVFYRKLTGGRLAPVRRNVEAAYRAGVHVEVTNFLVTDANDAPEQVAELVEWLAGVSPEIPLHFSRYFPQHHHRAPATAESRMRRALALGREKLQYVFAGNIHLDDASDTCCPDCGARLIARTGYCITREALTEDGACGSCGRRLPLVLK